MAVAGSGGASRLEIVESRPRCHAPPARSPRGTRPAWRRSASLRASAHTDADRPSVPATNTARPRPGSGETRCNPSCTRRSRSPSVMMPRPGVSRPRNRLLRKCMLDDGSRTACSPMIVLWYTNKPGRLAENLNATPDGHVIQDVADEVGRPAEDRLGAVSALRGVDPAIVHDPHVVDAAVGLHEVVIEHVQIVVVDVDRRGLPLGVCPAASRRSRCRCRRGNRRSHCGRSHAPDRRP